MRFSAVLTKGHNPMTQKYTIDVEDPDELDARAERFARIGDHIAATCLRAQADRVRREAEIPTVTAESA